MPRFLRNLGRFLLLQSGIAALLWGAAPRDPNHLLAAGQDKAERLRTAPDPRVVLVGGSNLSYGLDSPRLWKATGLQPVNLGLYSRMGIEPPLSQALSGLRPGDRVVVSMEYNKLAFDTTDFGVFLLAEHQPGFFRHIDPHQWPRLLDEALPYAGYVVRGALRALVGRWRPSFPPASRDSFNEWGDMVAHAGLPDQGVRRISSGLEHLNTRRLNYALGVIERFRKEAQALGARVYWAWPPLPASHAARFGPALVRIERAMRERVGIPWLYSQNRVVYPDEAFYNSPYHLGRDAARWRTDLIVEGLRRWGEFGPVPSPENP